MSRAVCTHCLRPQKVCICDFIQPIDNLIEIGILQHPTEAKLIKGTAIIAISCLKRCKHWVGESLTELPDLVAWLNDCKPVLLLYPETEDSNHLVKIQSIEEIKSLSTASFKILILDGTWRKTFKMVQLNPELNRLPRLALSPKKTSNYRIRKQKDEQSLSTVEAIYELLLQLEGNIGVDAGLDKFEPLLTAFEKMQQQQLAFIKPTKTSV